MKSLQPRTGLFYIKRVLMAAGHLISTYLSMILTVGFVVPWILGAIQIHNYEQVLSFIEVFVLVAATLSLLSFTYIMALTNMHEKVKKINDKGRRTFLHVYNTVHSWSLPVHSSGLCEQKPPGYFHTERFKPELQPEFSGCNLHFDVPVPVFCTLRVDLCNFQVLQGCGGNLHVFQGEKCQRINILSFVKG